MLPKLNISKTNGCILLNSFFPLVILIAFFFLCSILYTKEIDDFKKYVLRKKNGSKQTKRIIFLK